MVSLNPHLGNRQNARKPGRNIAENLEFWMGPVAQLLQNQDLQIRTDACSTPSACSPAPLNTQRRRQCWFLTADEEQRRQPNVFRSGFPGVQTEIESWRISQA